VPKNLVEALKWLELAADGGNQLARERLDALRKNSSQFSQELLNQSIWKPSGISQFMDTEEFYERNPRYQRPSESIDEWAERVRKEMKQP
jgi:TPR repeat protein